MYLKKMWWEQFTTSKKSQLDRSFCAPLLPSVYFYYPQIQLTKNVITTLTNQVKSPHQQWYQKPEPFEIHASGTVAHILTVNSTGTYKGIRKPVDLPHWFGVIHYCNRTDKRLVFQCSTITKSLICLKCNSILCLKLFRVWK